MEIMINICKFWVMGLSFLGGWSVWEDIYVAHDVNLFTYIVMVLSLFIWAFVTAVALLTGRE